MNWARGLLRVTLIVAAIPAGFAAYTGVKIFLSPIRWDDDVQAVEISVSCVAAIFGCYFLSLWIARGFMSGAPPVILNWPSFSTINVRRSLSSSRMAVGLTIITFLLLVTVAVVGSRSLWNWWSDTFDYARMHTDVPGQVTAYSFRHGMARLMRNRKVPGEQIDLFLGHLPSGHAATTAIYAPFGPEHCSEAVAAIEDVFNEIRKHLKVRSLDDPDVKFRGRPESRGGVHLTQSVLAEIDNRLAAGASPRAVSRHLKVSLGAVYRRRKNGDMIVCRPNYSRRLTDDERAEVDRMLLAGEKPYRISKIFGVSSSAIYKRKHTLGIGTEVP